MLKKIKYKKLSNNKKYKIFVKSQITKYKSTKSKLDKAELSGGKLKYKRVLVSQNKKYKIKHVDTLYSNITKKYKLVSKCRWIFRVWLHISN